MIKSTYSLIFHSEKKIKKTYSYCENILRNSFYEHTKTNFYNNKIVYIQE